MDKKFLDPNLRVKKEMYEYICVPLRLIIGFLFLIDAVPHSFFIPFAVLLLIVAAGLYRKKQISGNSWKCYQRAIIVYVVIALMIFWNSYSKKIDTMNMNMTIGALLVGDVLAGIQSKHIFTKLS